MLTARKLLQCKLQDVEMSLRGMLRGFGLKVGKTTRAHVCRTYPGAGCRPSGLEVMAEALLEAACRAAARVQRPGEAGREAGADRTRRPGC